ncbi:MAG: MATE family efflux transporter, partial [Desulfovibrio sp.]
MQFTDRVFLAHYSLDAIAASQPAGVANFLLIAFFFGTVGYVSVFVAQYTGSGQHNRVGAALWQGIWFALFSVVCLALLSLIARPVFTAAGHPPTVTELEIDYFRILQYGSGLAVLETGLSSFYSGRGLTRTIMLVNMFGAGINIPLDYCLINGVWIFPKLGIQGAALATVTAWGVIAGSYLLLIFRRNNESCFGVRSGWKIDKQLFGRLMRFGLPGGVHFFLDILAVTLFLFLVGRIGVQELAATNMVFSIYLLSLLPMIGMSIATSTLVGQAMGGQRPDRAKVAVHSAMHLTMVYMIVVAVIFLVLPETILSLFRTKGMDPAQFDAIRGMGVIMLRFVAAYSIFDALAITFFGALKGAGDTQFLMWGMGFLALIMLALPVYICVEVLGGGVMTAWSLFTFYIFMLALVMGWRYYSGKWQSIRVIEQDPADPGKAGPSNDGCVNNPGPA